MEKLLSSQLQCIITVATVFDWMSMLKGNQPKKKNNKLALCGQERTKETANLHPRNIFQMMTIVSSYIVYKNVIPVNRISCLIVPFEDESVAFHP